MEEFDKKLLKRELMIDAKGVGIPSGAAEIFIDHTLENLEKEFRKKKIITKSDLKRFTVRELKKYNSDLAYVYKNRDTII